MARCVYGTRGGKENRYSVDTISQFVCHKKYKGAGQTHFPVRLSVAEGTRLASQRCHLEPPIYYLLAGIESLIAICRQGVISSRGKGAPLTTKSQPTLTHLKLSMTWPSSERQV